MGRSQNPIKECTPALRALCTWLRAQRGTLSYRHLAGDTPYSWTSLRAADSGGRTPTREVVLAYARACAADEDKALQLWREARRSEHRAKRGRHNDPPAPRPEFVHDRRGLSAALVDLWERAGVPSVRQMAKLAGGYGVLPRSTAHRIITQDAVPTTLEQFHAYLRACELPDDRFDVWTSAWQTAWRSHEDPGVSHLRKAHQDRLGAMGPHTARVLAACDPQTPRRLDEVAMAAGLRCAPNTVRQLLRELLELQMVTVIHRRTAKYYVRTRLGYRGQVYLCDARSVPGRNRGYFPVSAELVALAENVSNQKSFVAVLNSYVGDLEQLLAANMTGHHNSHEAALVLRRVRAALAPPPPPARIGRPR